MDGKICPMMKCGCLKNKCAWYYEHQEKCSVLEFAEDADLVQGIMSEDEGINVNADVVIYDGD